MNIMLSLANVILSENIDAVRQMLRRGADVNQIDEYGYTPLIEAAIVEDIAITQLLLEQDANPNLQDVTGGTPLQWAVENANAALVKLLLKHHANPNACNFAGQPVLAMATLRRQWKLRKILLNAGADPVFAQDYINTKLLGHLFELVGTVSIVDPSNKFVEVDFEGFYLEVTLGLVADALQHFQGHFAARQLRRYSGLSQYIVEIMHRALQLIRFQQYRVDIRKHLNTIQSILQNEPLLIPVGYEGHAITFIKSGNIWVKCDRREDSRLYDNIMFYRIRHPEKVTEKFIMSLIYQKQSSEFINQEIDYLLGLEPITELKIEAQVSGNCSWANVEACIPAIFFLVLMQGYNDPKNMSYHKTLALNYFHRWREWNKDRALDYSIRSFEEADSIRKASKAEVLAAILFQRASSQEGGDKERIERVFSLLIKSKYKYILQNYLRVYFYENYTEEGRRFSNLLREHGFFDEKQV